MASFLGRNGRRRRVLNEEVLSTSSSQLLLHSEANQGTIDDDAPRYCEAASVEHHAQVTDFVPRRYRTLSLLVVLGLASVAGLAALDHWAGSIAGVLGMRTKGPLDFAAPGSLAAWMAAVVLLAASAACLVVYSIRRLRIDDFRGRYRVWVAAAVVCLLLSINSVAALHRVLAEVASYHTGWWALRDGAVWWLVLAVMPAAWVTFRALLDVLECRLAASALLAALLVYLGALSSHLGWRPDSFDPRSEPLVTIGLTLVGHWMLLVAVVCYARFVVLDAQGLIAARSRTRRRAAPAKRQIREPEAPESTRAAADAQPQPAAKDRATQWVDGRRPERDQYDQDEMDRPGRKLGKAERKQLRKLKALKRAA